ncbi:MAG: hypothetical protein FH761_10470 [Firmicutes bacterium]|nr:hypothetical protein [Bacillota bacterium]
MITAEESDKIYQANKCTDTGLEVSWTPILNKQHYQRYKLKIPIFTNDGLELSLIGNYSNSRRGKNYSFGLFYKGASIRRWDFKPHNYAKPTSHKHRWDGINDHESYEVDDICLTNVNKAFYDFLIECNIKLLGTYCNIM